MAIKDYLPHGYAMLNIWLNNFLTYLKANLARFGMTDEDTVDLNAAANGFFVANSKADNPNAGKADRLDRKEKSIVAYAVIRAFVNRYLRFNPAVTDEDRVNMGLTVSDPKPTPSPIPVTFPVSSADTSTLMRLTLHYHDSNSTSRARPTGVIGAWIQWAILDAPPSDTDDLIHSAFSTRTPHMFEFRESDRGRTAYFRLSWENTRGEKGPWSEITSSIIP